MDYFTNLSHVTCRIIFFLSLSLTRKVTPLLSTWTTPTPPQNIQPPVFPTVLYCRLHYLPFTFLTWQVLCTLISPYMQTTLPFCLRPDTISRRLSHPVTTLLKYVTTWKLRLNTHKTEIIVFSKRRLPPPGPFSNPWHLCAMDLGSTLFRPCAILKTSLPASRNLNFKLSVSPLTYAKKKPPHSRIFRSLLTYVVVVIAMRRYWQIPDITLCNRPPDMA
jgi:hypothetical protein